MSGRIALVSKMVVVAAITAVMASPAAAFLKSGRITNTFLSGGSNLAFRVTLDNYMGTDCPGNFAYVNTSSDNYQAFVSALLTAYVSGKNVQLQLVIGQQGFCQIIEFSVG